MNKEAIIALLKEEVLPTMGCTEPGAVALAAAYASEKVEGKIKNIEVIVNPNIYKNGVAVGIPGTGETGLEIAAALGAIKKHSERQLQVLAEVKENELAEARALIAANLVKVRVDGTKSSLWVKVRIEAEEDWGEATIAERHTNLVSLVKKGEIIFQQEAGLETPQMDYRSFLRCPNLTVREIIHSVEKIDAKEIQFLLDGVEMNLQAAQVGLDKKLGMGIGAMYKEAVDKGLLSDDLINYAKILTAAASDARMSGENVQVMSSAGSGNHGITATLPVYAVANKTGITQDLLVQALAISHLITIYIKIHTGNLSALCGCAVAAATGASAGITWLMDGKINTIEAAMKNIIANITGMICDGGKVGCALKLSTAAAVAVESSLFAQNNIVVPHTNGIIADTIEKTIENLGEVSSPGMIETDRIILDVMLAKRKE